MREQKTNLLGTNLQYGNLPSRQLLEPFFHKEFEPAHAPKEARHLAELTSLTSR